MKGWIACAALLCFGCSDTAPGGALSLSVEHDEDMECLLDPNLGACPGEEAPIYDGDGHCDWGGDYDIFENNCHSATNEDILDDPENTGAIICGGEPDNGDPAHHTFTWRLEGNTIVYYNYAEQCYAPFDGTVPPDITAPDHSDCVERFCGDQYDGDERAGYPGSLIEDPGADSCLNEVSEAACNGCCQDIADTWRGTVSDDEADEFLSGCQAGCYEEWNPTAGETDEEE